MAGRAPGPAQGRHRDARARAVVRWLDDTVLGLAREFRLSYLPPLMVYVAAGVSGLTAIVGTFFVKDYLGLSAAFLAGLGFWAGIPWTLKMPLGHLVDLLWRWKSALVWVGAAVIALAMTIMYALIAHTEAMTALASAEAWFVASALLAPTGYVIQDVVADAMTVEAVPIADAQGRRYDDAQTKRMHTTMQTLGRFAIIGGSMGVAALNMTLFANVEQMSEADKAAVYADVYLMALAIPAVSVLGVVLGGVSLRRRARAMRRAGVAEARIESLLHAPAEPTAPNWWILGGSVAFVAFTLAVGLSEVALSQEIVFVGAMAIVAFLIRRLLPELPADTRRALLGTAIVVFVFRAVPLPGAGATWFEIDQLGFDQRFLSLLTLVASGLTLVGMVVLRPMMATRPIAWIVAVLTLAGGVLALPNIGLYYGVQEWTARWTGGVVDARFIALVDTAVESPLGQVAMIPMLAWIARNAPARLKATFFAVMASFTNLALSASSLATKYLNQVFVVTREVRDAATGAVEIAADYSELGALLVCVAAIGVAAPLAVIWLVQHSPLRTEQ